ncbi:MAG: VWA domain-containing protein [Planctomycetales bacterium]|nr:VWA domain-containing protein [Planctomycetales bacterium]
MSNSSITSSGNPTNQPSQLWQGDRRSTSLVVGLRRRMTQLMWGGLLVTSLLLFAWFVWLLLLSPKRTPLVVLAAAPYSWPLPPNDWVAEDLEHLASLDGQTISLQAVDAPIYKAAEFAERLDEQIARAEALDHRIPLIVWISMHGVAEQAGDAIHLIPPGASPTEPESWIDFQTLADQLEKVDDRRQVLLILDCNRMLVNWNVGLIANRFADKVASAYRKRIEDDRTDDRHRARNLSILMSAGSGQVSAASADLNGSVFGTYLRMGLAGDADRLTNGGNGDGWVQIQELHRYVRSRVAWWAQQCLGKRQTPILLSPDTATDFRLARSLNETDLDKLISNQAAGLRPARTVPETQLDGIWKSIDLIRAEGLYRQEPIAFRNLEHDALWLEQLSNSGKGYQTIASRTLERVRGDLAAIQRRIAKLPGEHTISTASSLVSGKPSALPRGLRVHSLSLAEFFGTQPVDEISRLRNQLAKLMVQPDQEVLAETLTLFDENANTQYASAHFVKMLQRYQTAEFWQDQSTISDLLKLQAEIHDFSVPRDGDGMPTDLRVHRWNRRLIADVDSSRRAAEDQAFLNQQNDLKGAIRLTRMQLQDAASLASLADQSLQVCDRSMATVPYFAQWVAHPGRRQDPGRAKGQIDQSIVPLIENTIRLASQSAAPFDETSDIADEVRRVNQFAMDQVSPVLGSLYNDWIQAQKQLVFDSESGQPDTIGEIEAALSIPLVDWKSRRELRNALDRLTAGLHQALESPDGEVESSDQVDEGYFAEVASWNRHPLDVILGDDLSKSEVNEKDGGTNRIATFMSQSASRLAESGRENTISGQRRISSEVALQIRAAAPIWFPAPKRNAIDALRQIDLQSLLMWHAERSLADFWGPAGGDRSFFDIAASDYCRSVAEMNSGAAGGDQGEGTQQDRRPLEVRAAIEQIGISRESLPQWIATTSGPTIQLDSNDPFQSRFTITTKSDTQFNPPTGTASIVVRSDSQRIAVPRIEPSDAVTLPAREPAGGPAGAGQTFVVTLPAELATNTNALKAQTIFRGHEFGGALNVDQLGGVKVDVPAPSYRHSDVTLSGPWDSLSVVFVLDCSASMDEPLSGDGPTSTSTRLEVAKSALQELLFNLGLRRNVRVGVRAFGHRLGWSVDEPVQPLTRPDFTGTLDPALTPSQDVESIFGLNDFRLADAQAIVPLIGELKPWGQSPLYLSVLQSLADFSSADARSDRHVIVITDGANYQFIPPSVRSVQETTDNDVRQAWANVQAPVHILGLGMDRTQQQAGIDEFTRLCRDTGGRFQSLTSSTDLARALRELLAPGGYRLIPLQSDKRPEQQATLGTPIRVTPVPAGSESFGVQYEGRHFVDVSADDGSPSTVEPVALEGGEALQLYVNEAGTDIFAYPFQDNMAAFSEMINVDGARTDHVVRVHRPSRQPGGRVTFPLSWQRRDSNPGQDNPRWRVTHRPPSVWIEIQPIGLGGKALDVKYVFCDATFVADQPVPMIDLAADQWPPQATAARIRVWSKPPIPPSEYELLPPKNLIGGAVTSSRLNKIIAINDSLQNSSPIAPGVTLRIDPLGSSTAGQVGRRRFVVEYSDPNADVTSIKVGVDSSMNASPVRIVRQFDSQHHISVHTFYYDTSQGEFPSEVRVTNRDHEIEGAWKLQNDFLEVAIPDSGGLLPVGQAQNVGKTTAAGQLQNTARSPNG